MSQTISNQFLKVCKANEKRTALAYLSNGKYQQISYKQFNDYRIGAANFLKKLGATKGDKLAIILPNSPEWAIFDFASAALGVTVVPIHNNYNIEYIIKVLKHSDSRYMVLLEEYFNDNKDYLAEIDIKKIIISDKKPKDDKLFFWNKNSKLDLKEIDVQIEPDDLHTIIYTSGTTGDPKGVMLSHKNIIADSLSAKRSIEIFNTDKFFSFLPLSHAFERMAGHYCAIFSGASIYYAASKDSIIEDIKKARPTILTCVPRIFEKIYANVFEKLEKGGGVKKKLFFEALSLGAELKKNKKQRLKNIRFKFLDKVVLSKVRAVLGGKIRIAISGGASLDAKVAKFFETSGIKVIEGYGLTETSPIIAVNKLHNYKFGTVGLAVDCNEVKISDKKEIIVKGDNVMLGYYKDKDKTKEVIDSKGYFHTGDLGFIDQDGFLTIIGRAKDVIVLSTGKNIFPEPIENILNESKYISQSMVYGDGEKHISAIIVPNFVQLEKWCVEKNIELNLQNENIKDFYKQKINRRLEKYSGVEKVNNFRLIEKEFSVENGLLTPTLKLRRHVINNLYNK